MSKTNTLPATIMLNVTTKPFQKQVKQFIYIIRAYFLGILSPY